MSGYGVKEARYNTRLAKNRGPRVNLCGDCGREIAETELLCLECRGTMPPSEAESEIEQARQ